jgi:hypothetical protein
VRLDEEVDEVMWDVIVVAGGGFHLEIGGVVPNHFHAVSPGSGPPELDLHVFDDGGSTTLPASHFRATRSVVDTLRYAM